MVWILPTTIAALALILSVIQEIRHWRESAAKLEVDVRTVWRMRDQQDRVILISIEILAFNPSMKGVAISHVRIDALNRPEVSLDLARPKRLGSEWELEPLGSSKTLRVSGDYDLPYTLPPITLPARQGGSAILAFIPDSPVPDLDPAGLKVFVRLGSRRTNRIGFLGWRKLVHRELPLFDELEARWIETGFVYAGTKLSEP